MWSTLLVDCIFFATSNGLNFRAGKEDPNRTHLPMDLISSSPWPCCSNHLHIKYIILIVFQTRKPRTQSCLVFLMATSLLSPLSSLTKELPAPTPALPKSSFLSHTKFFNFTPSSRTKLRVERCYITSRAESLDHVPKQFREQNLKDGCEFSITHLFFSIFLFVYFTISCFGCSKNAFLLVEM